MSIGTLYTIDANKKGTIIRATAAYAGLIVDPPVAYKHFETNYTPEYKAKFPHGKIPAFEGSDGFLLFEGAAIARYVASLAKNVALLGNSPQEAALVDQWTHLVESEVDGATGAILLMTSGKTPYNKPAHTLHLENQQRALQTLEQHISTRTYFVGERITLADITIATLIHISVRTTIDKEVRAKLPHLMRHHNTISNHPSIKPILGETQFVEKGVTFVPAKKETKVVEKVVDKVKAVVAPKAAKKKDDEDEDDSLVPPEPKVKNPLDDLPKSTFDLEQWKREYSNKDTRGAGGSLEWFYQNFDPASFDVSRVSFKYPGELTQTFMSSNQIGGFFNRLEASRKYLFGSVGVLGTNNDSLIEGILISRGKNVAAVVECAPDWESYEYKTLDLSKDEDKKFFEAACAWDLEVDGKKWVDGKNFK
ncbi:elongation factor 1-gamma [Mycena floridula]|nr:elongation factor 1-gamma [Mycena floridula]